MNIFLDALAEVLEAEAAVGEELRRNLAAQKDALVTWDLTELLGLIEAREPWLGRLGELEQRRCLILNQCDGSAKLVSLRHVIGRLPQDSAYRSRLTDVRERSRIIFTRLQADERDFHMLMAKLSAFIEEALSPLLKSAVPTYGDSGATERPRPTAALLQSKA